MGFIDGLVLGIAIGAAAFSWAAYRNMRTHLETSALAQCIADMCRAPSVEVAKRIAEDTHQDLKRRGLWKS